MERGEDLPKHTSSFGEQPHRNPQEAMGAQTRTSVDKKVEQLEHPRLCPV